MGRRVDAFEEGFQRDDVLAPCGDFEEGAVEGRERAEGAGGGGQGRGEGGLEVGLQGVEQERGLEGCGVGGLRRGREEVEGHARGCGAGFSLFRLGVCGRGGGQRRRRRRRRGGRRRRRERRHGEFTHDLLSSGAEFLLHGGDELGLEGGDNVHAREVLAFFAGARRGEKLP